MLANDNALKRCGWVTDDPLYRAYHDHEWGVPCRDERALFELLILEGAQAGLSWLTVLRRREGYRRAFDQFDVDVIAGYDQQKVESLLADPGIIRNRLKVAAAIGNAQAWLALRELEGGPVAFLWSFVDGEPVINHWPTLAQVPATAQQSDAMSKALKQRGFKFVGSTICYAFMQATGMVNDHTAECFLGVEKGA